MVGEQRLQGPVLKVADGPLTGNAAPVPYFTPDEGWVRFAVSLTTAAARGLKRSSRLLAVAQSAEAH